MEAENKIAVKRTGRPRSIELKQTPEEIREQRRRCKDPDIKYKLLAVIAYAERKSREECAGRVERTWRCVWDWIKAYHSGGVVALRDGRKDGNNVSRLSEAQQAELARIVVFDSPEAHGLEAPVWCGDLVCKLIESRYGVRYHPHYMSALMDRLGLTRVRAKGFYPEGDPEKARAFKEEIKKKANRLN